MFVTVLGGCGYIGSVLVPKLLRAGHQVRVIDLGWFGNYLESEMNLEVIKADIRDADLDLSGTQVLIHLANVANDPAGDLDPKLTWEVNALGMALVCQKALQQGVKRFIYASSGSVYGVSDAPQVHEGTPLVPLTEYNKSKMVAERVLLSYSHRWMAVQIIRPGTVCGVSPRQRLDITVNSFTAQACNTGRIDVVGGALNRPNVHIQDLTDLFLWMLDHPEHTGVWNAGFENLTGNEIAGIVASKVPCTLSASESPDRRSYRMNSDKLLRAGFKPKHTVADAVDELIAAHAAGRLAQEDRCVNVKLMRRLALA